MHRLKRRFITLVEMMIVMFLIAMITGAIAYNYTGSLEEGKAFKSKAGMENIERVLNLYYAVHPEESNNVGSEWKSILRGSPMVKNASELEKDGWGSEYQITQQDGEIQINSVKYNEYLKKKGGNTYFGSDKK